jgi:RNA polymerase subunit RPABC4/transcription elongation factor Spt4
MEITCQRCHETLQAENRYCPACGLPQLVYTTEETSSQPAPERWTGAVLDASMVNWKPAMRLALLLAVPTGLLTSGISPVGMLGLFWMAGAAAWAVTLYVRSQRPAWITMGAGARIGLVTGLLAGWLAFSVSGGALFVQRYVLHQSSQIDSDWKTRVELSQQMTEQFASEMGVADKAQEQAQKAWMMSPAGHAGIETFGFLSNALFLLFFAAGGGALGARVLARSRRSGI